MNQLLTDAVCGETVPAWVETVDELDAEIKQCETLGWRAGPGSEWVAELRQYRAAIDDQRAAVARRDAALAACGIDDPAGFAPASLDDIDDPAVMAWLACGPGTESGCSASQSDPSGWSPMPGDDVVAAGNGAGGPPSAAAPGPAVDKAAPAANRRSASAWVSPSAAAISPTPNSSSPSAATRVCAPVPSVARRPAEPCAVMRRSPVAGWRPASIEAKSLRPTGPSRPSVRAVRPSQRPGSSALSA